jgi:hypothetical protein
MSRTRAEGWKFAKLSGHENEAAFGAALTSAHEFVEVLYQAKYGLQSDPIHFRVLTDGMASVPDIAGGSTIAKPDIVVEFSDEKFVNISLKKSFGGQVWLASLPRLIEVLEKGHNITVPEEVRFCLSLFIGGSNTYAYQEFFDLGLAASRHETPKVAEQEAHQNRLVAQSINRIAPSEWDQTLGFFRSNIDKITSAAFSRGAALNPRNWADFLIYTGVPIEDGVFSIATLIAAAKDRAEDLVTPGPRNGGSTIQLPTGFMQMHKPQGENQVQFHHSYKKICLLPLQHLDSERISS